MLNHGPLTPVHWLCCVPTHQLLREITKATHQNHTSGCTSAEPRSRVVSYPCRPSSQFFYWGIFRKFCKATGKRRTSVTVFVCLLHFVLLVLFSSKLNVRSCVKTKGFLTLCLPPSSYWAYYCYQCLLRILA